MISFWNRGYSSPREIIVQLLWLKKKNLIAKFRILQRQQTRFCSKCRLVGCRMKAYCLYERLGPERERVPSVGAFLSDPSLYLCEFRRKTMENSERLGRQARPRIEPGISRLPISEQTLSATGGANIGV